MSENLIIKSFTVYKLFGMKNHTVNFTENKIILYGINGSYKTTMLTMFYYFMSIQWEELLEYEFDKIEVVLNKENHVFSITKDQLDYLTNLDLLNIFIEMLPNETRKPEEIISELFTNLTVFSNRIRKRLVENQSLLEERLQKIIPVLKSIIDINKSISFVFLPSYRHIESSLVKRAKDHKYFSNNNLYSTIEDIQDAHVTKGMDDVANAIKIEILKSESNSLAITSKYAMKLFAESFSGTVTTPSNQELETINRMSEENFSNILETIKPYIDNKSTFNKASTFFKKVKGKAKDSIEKNNRSNVRNLHAAIRAILLFLPMQKEIEQAQKKIHSFFEMTNRYFEVSGKKIVKEKFIKNEEDAIKMPDGRTISIHGLSSGEQQLLSIFSRVYLFPKDIDLFIIIDEPEMSLSLPWQYTFLKDLMNGNSTKGLLAASHSPDIIKEISNEYVGSIQEDTPSIDPDDFFEVML